jgi:hypothetical protein
VFGSRMRRMSYFPMRNSDRIRPVELSSPVTFRLAGWGETIPAFLSQCFGAGMRAVGEYMSIFERLKELRESSRFTGLAFALLGVMKLLNDLGKPRVEALHGVDVLGLLASGGLLGVGFVGLMGGLNSASSRKDQSRPPRNE